MYRAFVILGMAFDVLIALFLLIVVGWIVDAWNDRDPWAGPVVTTIWLVALVMSAGAPILAYRLRQRQATPGKVALAVWLPAIVLVAVTMAGFAIFPL
jgi:hypothetical protein